MYWVRVAPLGMAEENGEGYKRGVLMGGEYYMQFLCHLNGGVGMKEVRAICLK